MNALPIGSAGFFGWQVAHGLVVRSALKAADVPVSDAGIRAQDLG